MATIEKMRFSETYHIVTEDSAEHGDFAETGFNWEDTDYSFKEIVDYVKRHYSVESIGRWISDYPEQNYHDGSYTTKHLHPTNNRAKRYWNLICKAVS
jgi:hypothetical protein